MSKNGIAVAMRAVYDEFSGISVNETHEHKHHNKKIKISPQGEQGITL